ncbi:pre-mRNA-splicing factor syf2-like [Cucurbita pepo subsp. pepo]|uniref:pre-mRNA-splicing factor syf2-like n=2 Tax=Cucurbita pepo subsp. pepo TaxID=3664 RepID=UPI000C9D9676|nr:pre-mRNA-splicing factor syf2-like [Cucurbita pepo subsp. pepo]
MTLYLQRVRDVVAEMSDEGRVHPDCRNASNPYHECSEYCFEIIAEVKARNQQNEPVATSSEAVQAGRSSAPSNFAPPDEYEDLHDEKPEEEGHSDGDTDKLSGEENVEGDFTKLTGRKKKLFELRLKMNEARKANQTAIAAEKKKMEPPSESRGISKQKWLEERKKKIGKLLDANGLDMTKAYMLDTQEAAESKYKKWEKDPAPYGWDVFNQKTLYDAYKKRTKNVNVDLEEYNKMKESDPEFYREASSLQYGKAPKISEDKIDNMVKELKDREEKRKSFSRRRKFHEDKDIDSINDRNEHFNKKIERAFGRYTLEIKNNLERGTALPD